MLESGESIAVFTVQQKAYVAFGSGHALVRGYDPATNMWSREADFLGPVSTLATCLSLGNKGYIVGGRGFGNDLHADMWEFSPE